MAAALTGAEHSEVTMALSKKEMKEHLSPDMDALFADMSTRSVVVRAVPIDSPPPSFPGYTLLKTKSVHLARHGQGFHNMLADSYRQDGKEWEQFVNDERNPYVRGEILDAPLTQKGRLQAEALREVTKAMDPPVELVIVSPQCRATQTGLIGFSHLLSAGGKKKFVAHEFVREESGVHVCDQRRSISNARVEFPQVDWDGIEHDKDPLFSEDRRETKKEVGERIYKFLLWMMELEEESLGVASHSGWLMTFFNGVCVSDDSLKPWFQTGELRSVKLVFMQKNE